MDSYELLVQLHLDGQRQGPGSDEVTLRAVELAGLKKKPGLRILDAGCGTGAQTLALAMAIDCTIVAVDLFPVFLDRLQQRAAEKQCAHKIQTLACSMDALEFPDDSFDVVWSEGAIYNLGFERGLRDWKRLIKPGGCIAVSELSWLSKERPEEIDRHWAREYQGIATAGEKIRIIEELGYRFLAAFTLPVECWTSHYYLPLQARFADFLRRYESPVAESLVGGEMHEIALYERFKDYFGYVFYIAQRMI